MRQPNGLLPGVLGVFAVVIGILTWALLETRPISTEFAAPTAPLTDPARMRSVAYIEPSPVYDRLYVRSVQPQAAPDLVATFPSAFGTHARGSASPLGDRAAIVWFDGAAGSHLAIVSLPSGGRVEAASLYLHLTTLPWSQDGARLAAVAAPSPAPAGTFDVHEINAETAAATIVATFANVLEVVPVGYTIDGRLFIVVIDQSGSWLWVQRGARVERLAQLSTGRTRDWSLSPDGARLAFIDILGAGGQRGYAGRSILTATGTILSYTADQDQHGTVWSPRSEVPHFGGPGGSVQLTYPSSPGDYLIPNAWAPAGDVLVASVFTGGAGAVVPNTLSLQLLTADTRIELSGGEGASFVGFVQDFD